MAGYNGYNNYNSYNQGGYEMLPAAATFYPGGSDDYYMPELVSPAPQRCVANRSRDDVQILTLADSCQRYPRICSKILRILNNKQTQGVNSRDRTRCLTRHASKQALLR